jgi:putative salt-induced outer membrane protein
MKSGFSLLVGTLTCFFASTALHAQGRPSDPVLNRFIANSPQSGDGRWKGTLGFGMTLNKGNSESTQASLTADATRTLRDSRIILRTLLIHSTNGGDTTVDNDQGEARYERNFAQSAFGYGDITLERDPFRDLNLRQSYAGGLGYRLLKREDTQLNVYAGVSYTLEDRKMADNARGWEPTVGNDLTYKISETASIAERWVIFPTTVGNGGVRSIFQVDLNMKLVGRVGVQISFLNKYRQHVGQGEKSTDSILFTGITAGF